LSIIQINEFAISYQSLLGGIEGPTLLNSLEKLVLACSRPIVYSTNQSIGNSNLILIGIVCSRISKLAK